LSNFRIPTIFITAHPLLLLLLKRKDDEEEESGHENKIAGNFPLKRFPFKQRGKAIKR
jgi:hypothetical protein